MIRRAVVLFAALALAGCAARPVELPVSAPPPAAAPAPAPARPATPAAAAVDSTPSPEALAVLAGIPEPLGPAAAAPSAPASRPARPATPAKPAEPVAQAAPEAAFDSLRTEVPASGDVPVPAPTRPLGAPTVAPPVAPPVAAPTVAPVAPPAASAPPDTCWRVQVAAPADRAKGKSLRDAAESLLLVPMIVDREGGRFKVRSRDCLSRTAAESLRDRAVASGFKGVFLVKLPGGR